MKIRYNIFEIEKCYSESTNKFNKEEFFKLKKLEAINLPHNGYSSNEKALKEIEENKKALIGLDLAIIQTVSISYFDTIDEEDEE